MIEKQDISEGIVKDIGEITNRLFDHRPFLNGEISFFLNEFEISREDTEVENLFVTIQKTTESKLITNKCKIAGEKNLKNFQNTLNEVLTSVTDILNTENNNSELSVVLEQNRITRNKVWEDFLIDQEYKKEQIEQKFEQDKKEISDFYIELEKKLNIHV